MQRASSINDIAGALERELLAERLIAPGDGEERNLVSPRGLDEAIEAFLLDPASADEATIAAVESFEQRLPALRAALDADALDTFEALVAARDALAARSRLPPRRRPTRRTSNPPPSSGRRSPASSTALQDFDTSIFIDSATTEDALTLEMTAALREAVALQGASFSSLLTSDEVDAGLLVAAAAGLGLGVAGPAGPAAVRLDGIHPTRPGQRRRGAHRANRRRRRRRARPRRSANHPSIDVTTVRPAYLVGRPAPDRRRRRAVRRAQRSGERGRERRQDERVHHARSCWRS